MLLTCGNWLTLVQSSAISHSVLFDCFDHTNQIWIVKGFLARRDLYLAMYGTYAYVLNVILTLGQLQASIDCVRHFNRAQFHQQVAWVHQRRHWYLSMLCSSAPMVRSMSIIAWIMTFWFAPPTRIMRLNEQVGKVAYEARLLIE